MERLWMPHFSSTALVFSLSFFLATLMTAESSTLRYLHQTSGNDSAECLSVNPYPSQACRTLGYALAGNITDLMLLIWPGTYEYTERQIGIRHHQNVLIQKMPESEGKVIFQCRAYSEDSSNNLAFFAVENITISGITFEQCGPLSPGISADNSTNILVSKCTFRNNSGGGIIFTNTDNVHITNCTFAENVGTRPDQHQTTFNYRGIAVGGLAIIFTGTSNSTVTVSNCDFLNNTASVNDRNANDPRPQGYTPFGNGGAMGIIIREASTHNKVDVQNCRYIGNSAKYSGGSVHVSILQNSKNNSLVISNSTFWNSTAEANGGAISVNIFDADEENKVEVVDTDFYNGRAQFGGGALSIVIQESLVSSTRRLTSNPVVTELRRCNFEGNYSPTGGSAMGMVSNARVDRLSFIVNVTDCNFTRNRASNQSAVFTFRLPLVFVGKNIFRGNEGGAVYLLQTRLDAMGTLLFESNTAVLGGAVTFEDYSVINLHSGANVTFKGNKGDSVGGAILVDNPTLTQDTEVLFNSLCFLQYELGVENAKSLVPKQWENVSVTFASNTAGHAGAAIYAADISVCTFTNLECEPTIDNRTPYQRSIFLQSPFNLRGNQVTEAKSHKDGFVHNIATSPSILQVTPKRSMAAPSEVLSLEIVAHDQSGNLRESIWNVQDDDVPMELRGFGIRDTISEHSMTFQVANSSQASCNSQVKGDTLTGDQETLEFLIIQTLIGEVSNETDVHIDITCCQPGYHYNAINHTCVFNSDNPHLLRPDEQHRYLYLKPGYYAGFFNDTSLNQTYFTTVLFPTVFQKCTREGNRTGCLYQYDMPDEQCTDNRTGYMCGQCPREQGLDLTLRNCKECTALDAVVLVVICLLLVVFVVLVLVFNIGLPNEMRGFLFYAQVVGFVYLNGAQSASWDFHLSHLLGFSVYLPLCPFTALPTLWAVAFGFLPAVLATITVVVYILCARFIRPLSQRTAFSGIWLIFLFVYKYTADTTANILKCVKVEGEIDKRHLIRLAFYYDGTLTCFSGEHLILAIPSWFLLILVVFIVPGFITLISFKRFKITQPFTDVITDGIAMRRRWWSGFDVIRRLMYIVVVTVVDFSYPDYTQLALAFVTLIVLAVLCAAKPYTKTITNFIEAAILLDLLLLTIHFLNDREFRRISTPYSSYILFLLPFLYAILYISIRILGMIWKKYVPLDVRMLAKYYTSSRPYKSWPWRSSKPLLKRQSTDLEALTAQDALETEQQIAGGEEDQTHLETDYSHFREELLED